VRIAGGGEVGPEGPGRVSDVNVSRYGQLGRSVLRMIATLDAARKPPARGAPSYLTFAGMVLPAWVLKLLAIALVLPALIASIDALARARRRREPVARYFTWLGLSALPIVLGLFVAWLMSLIGLIDDATPAPFDPRSVNFNGTALAGLLVTGGIIAVGWLGLRVWGVRRRSVAAAPGAGCAVSLVLAALALPIAVLNPFAALILVPAVHLWMLATLTDVPRRASLIMAAIGLAPILFVVAYDLWRLGLSPLAGAYYLLLLITGNQTGVATTVALVILATVAASVGAILIARAPTPRRKRPHEEPQTSIFGPGGHAGPGMLGSEIGTGRR
jgi:hypothetical protein